MADLVVGRIYSAASSNPFDCYRFTAWTDGAHVIKMESSKPDSEDEWWLVISGDAGRDAIGPISKERVVWRFATAIGDYLKKAQQEAVLNNLCGHVAFCREAAMYLPGPTPLPEYHAAP